MFNDGKPVLWSYAGFMSLHLGTSIPVAVKYPVAHGGMYRVTRKTQERGNHLSIAISGKHSYPMTDH